MSESFSDLWASSNPVKSQAPKPRTLGVAANITPNVALHVAPDAFSMLASAGSSRPNSRPITPSSNLSNFSGTHVTVNSRSSASAGDAFGGLVSFGHSTSRDDGLTIAERAARAKQERKEEMEKYEDTFNSQGHFWEKYEGSSSIKSPIHHTQVKANELLDLDFLFEERTSTISQPLQTSNPTESTNRDDVWGLDLKAPRPAITVTPSTVSTTDTFDVDHLDGVSAVQMSHSKKPSRSNSPGNLDLNTREDQLLGAIESEDEGEGEDEDDILGALAKPVKAVQGFSSKPPLAPSPSHASSASPPPHIVGKIVEIGFSVQQAKDALAATSTGVDVEAALEILLHHDVSASSEDRREEEEIQVVDVERELTRRQEFSRSNAPAHSSPFSVLSDSPLTSQQGLQDQADKLLSQASTIGMTMFNKANTFWKESREKVVKVYGEQRSGNTGANGVNNNSRPRWMDNARTSRDDDGDELSTNEYQNPLHVNPVLIRPSRFISAPRRSEPSVSLFSDESIYRSPARRQSPASTSTSKIPSPSSGFTSALPPIVRPSVQASSSALSASGAHKSVGTEHFKLGRFSEAESAYSQAIDELPASHLLRIPLHNNRALARLKTGEYKGTVYDASEVLRIITGALDTAWHPGREAAGEGDGFSDAVGKALRRRAEAYEGLEKWKEAVGDWERLGAAAWVSARLKEDATKGAGRCRQMIRDGHSPTTTQNASHSKSKPQSQSKSKQISPARSSEALARVRAATMAQEKEDQARHDLKDVVDARLASWRTGKENNLRALIASLDAVLSPTFGWQTVGMSELISPGQLKVQYTKAIAKLHPDKLNVNNTTLEERMVANSVFGTLSEAWHASR